MKQKKKLIQLPKDVHDTLGSITSPDERDLYVKMLREKGWTLQSIADVLGVTRERVRQICVDSDYLTGSGIDTSGFILPDPPMHEVVERVGRRSIEPDPAIVARLLELQPKARQVRSYSTLYRAEAEEYTALLNKAHSVDGVTIYKLARILGVTHSALRFRLARYGYKIPKTPSTSKVYQPINPKNRAL